MHILLLIVAFYSLLVESRQTYDIATVCHNIAMRLKVPSARSTAWISNAQKITPHTKTFLFIIMPPYSGSTGVLGLVGGFSNVSTICSAKTWACEGTWLYDRKEQDNRWQANLTVDWFERLRVLSKHWDRRLPVLVEKSPPNILQAINIFKQLSARHIDVRFLFITRSTCYLNSHCHSTLTRNVRENKREKLWCDRYGVIQQWHAHRELLKLAAPVLHFRYEDLFLHVDAFVAAMKRFIPTIGYENINKGLPGDRSNNRFIGFLDYISMHSLTQKYVENIDSEELAALEYFGYL